MVSNRPKNLIELLSATLHDLEQSEELRQEDPAIHELRSSLVRAIAELSIQRTGKSSALAVLLPKTEEAYVPILSSQEPSLTLPERTATQKATTR